MIYTITLNPALDRELTVPQLVLGDVLRASDSRVDCGGKGFNVSRTLAVLGAPSIALGFAGGHTGAMLRDGLAAAGVKTDFVWIAGETRTNISIVTADHQQHIKVNEPGPLILPAEQAALRAQVRRRAQNGDWWVLAGSLPPGVAPTFYAELIADIQATGARVVLDTSGAALRHACTARPFLAKPNAAEAAELSGMPVGSAKQALAAAQTLADIPNLVISLGADGALLIHAGQGWLARPPAIEQRNPIGAGDALVAGMVWGLSQSWPHPEALRWAAACGASAAAQAGTTVGTYQQIAELAAHVEIGEIGPAGMYS